MNPNNSAMEITSCGEEDRIGDYDTNGNLMIAYTHGPGMDEPVALNINASTYFYIPDIQGSIRAIVDIDGNMMATYVYDVWGTLIAHNGTLSERNVYLYTGREYDWGTGIYYYRYRYYNPEIGRFMQSSWELNEEMNMYVYVNNDPVKGVDPTGHPYFPPLLPDHGNSGGYIGGVGVDIGPPPGALDCSTCQSLVILICTAGVALAGYYLRRGGPAVAVIMAVISLYGCPAGAGVICDAAGLCQSSQSSQSSQHISVVDEIGDSTHQNKEAIIRPILKIGRDPLISPIPIRDIGGVRV